MDLIKRIILKKREDPAINPTEMNIESTGTAQEKSVFFDTTEQHETTEKKLRKRQEETRRAKPTEPPVISGSCYYAIDPHNNSTIVNTAQLTKTSRIFIEHDTDFMVLTFKRQISGLPFD